MIFSLFLMFFGIQSLEFAKTLYGSSVNHTFPKSTFNYLSNQKAQEKSVVHFFDKLNLNLGL